MINPKIQRKINIFHFVKLYLFPSSIKFLIQTIVTTPHQPLLAVQVPKFANVPKISSPINIFLITVSIYWKILSSRRVI